ncbi:putative membrane protein [Bradyrhizobium sp. STM 3843]|uniref:DUF4396 domain-containing protein n=1 Tax=Bradyrhizobium sp. STM 3843 TaxID=551947 RepID=UPI0002404CF9|nr:DUF4396 domain-containing protein [Bradyrhizobium sp. STM 3843]CCE10500.1 putative membrane protein [Bradyrhizobium sp. STM 3843]
MPFLVNVLASLSLAVAIGCALWIAADEMRHPQRMRIMNVVWPITALYAGPLALAAYLSFGRNIGGGKHSEHSEGKHRKSEHWPPPTSVVKGATHCGAGCTLGDVIAETLLQLVPGLAVILGWHVLWRDKIFSAWVLDFILAFGFGILFQYFSIKPMHPELSRETALKRALQADTLSLIAWQIGMYAVMALAHFVVFPRLLGTALPEGSPAFWWVMQFAMLAGLATSYPVNRWLIASKLKEAM